MMYGIDISNNNGSVNIASTVSNGVKAVIMKATEGSTFIDRYLPEFYSQCKSLGVKTGAYHFLVLGLNHSPEKQAKNFYNVIKNYSLDCLVLDVESNGSNLNDYVQRFVKEFSLYSSQELVLYSYTGFLPNISDTTLRMFSKAWIANYNNKQDINSVITSRLNNCNVKVVGHQYSEKGSFGNFTGDVNVFTDEMFEDSLPNGYWKVDSTGWWFEYSDGSYIKDSWARLPKGNQNREAAWFLFDTKGYMKTSWQKDGGNWYYLDEKDGDMKTGWYYDKNVSKWYYLDENGVMKTGWIKDNGKWYYLNQDGSMATGWIKDGGNDYLLYSNGEMVQNTSLYGYNFDNNGVATKA